MGDQDSYVVCIVGGRHEFFPDADAAMRACSLEELRGIAAETLSDWPTGAADLVRRGDPASFFLVEMYASAPATLVTEPCSAGIKEGRRPPGPLLEALAAYERDMTAYGLSVVREAAIIGEQRRSWSDRCRPLTCANDSTRPRAQRQRMWWVGSAHSNV
jgi:hypothetical protein